MKNITKVNNDQDHAADYWKAKFYDLAEKVQVMMEIEEKFNKDPRKNMFWKERSAARKAVNEIVNPVKSVPASTLELWGK